MRKAAPVYILAECSGCGRSRGSEITAKEEMIMENKRTILIVEDDKYIIHFLSVSLKEEAYTFWTAGRSKKP